MSKSNNFLGIGNTVSGLVDGNKTPGIPRLQDYRHASRFYIDDYQVRAPKYGFLYYVNFLINQQALVGEINRNIGMYVKKVDLPKFSIKTEMLNQYNRKTQINTAITYSPISIDFHDDNAGYTNDLWASYYKHTFADGNYDQETTNIPKQFTDTKYGNVDYEYGMYNRGVAGSFFERIDIYVLHHTHHDHTLISIINPKITEWRHDTLNQSDGGKVLQNSMTLVYENVLYYRGNHNNSIDTIPNYKNEFYDPSQSPLSIGGNRQTNANVNIGASLRPSNAVIFDRQQAPAISGNPLYDKPGRARLYNNPTKRHSFFDVPNAPRQYGLVNPPRRLKNPLLDIASILAKDYVNKNGLGRVGPKGYNIASSVLNNSIRDPAGKYYEPPSNQYVPGVFNLPGGIGINVFKALNTGVDGKIRVNPAAILFPPKR